MPEVHGPFHRLGEPGGPGCPVTTIPIAMKLRDGLESSGFLIDAGHEATEIELLRTIAKMVGVRWGHDELGWWAAMPKLQIIAEEK